MSASTSSEPSSSKPSAMVADDKKRYNMSVSLVCLRTAASRRGLPCITSSPHSRLRQLASSSNRQCYATSTESLPRVAQPSIWHSIVPKVFRKSKDLESISKPRQIKEWNPATFFICIFLLIGSNAIQMLTLRNEYSSFSRKADQKIALLREVLDKVQQGEKVDVEKVLGTGDEEQEQEWKDVIKNIVEEDHLWAAKDRRREKRRLKKEQNTMAQSPPAKVTDTMSDSNPPESDSSSVQIRKAPTFY